MTKSFRPSKIWNYLTWLNLSLSCWFSEVVVHSCFSKYVFLKSLQYWRLFLSYRRSFTEHLRWLRWLLLDFRSKKKLFSSGFGLYCRQMNRFLFRTRLKTRVKPQKQPLELLCQKKCSKKQPSRGVLRKGLLKIYSKFTGEHLYWSVISIKLQSNFIEITLWRGCSTVNWRHIFRTAFPRNTPGWLLLVFLEILPISLKNTSIEVSF